MQEVLEENVFVNWRFVNHRHLGSRQHAKHVLPEPCSQCHFLSVSLTIVPWRTGLWLSFVLIFRFCILFSEIPGYGLTLSYAFFFLFLRRTFKKKNWKESHRNPTHNLKSSKKWWCIFCFYTDNRAFLLFFLLIHVRLQRGDFFLPCGDW